MALFKDIYSRSFFENFSDVLNRVLPGFNRAKFINAILDERFQRLELKQRMTRIVTVLHQFMPDSPELSIKYLMDIVTDLEASGAQEESVEYMFLPEYVATFGLEHFDVSVTAFEHITKFTSAEFAVRPFIQSHQTEMIKRMIGWAAHEHFMVRRLASEGCRPRLPWAMRLTALVDDPRPIIPILEVLKSDDTEIVRRSVANNVNDISKDHPDTALQLVQSWRGISKETDALVKHASRTLLKAGNKEALAIFGYVDSYFQVDSVVVETPEVLLGKDLVFSFSVSNLRDSASLLRVEYAIYHKLKNGSLSRKVFKISEKLAPPHSRQVVRRHHSIREISTRRYYAGVHEVSVIVNGKESDSTQFLLVV